MTPAERRLANDLCKRIADEKDYFLFQQLVEHLDELLARKQQPSQTRAHPRSHLINRSCGTVVPGYPIGGILT